MMDTEGLQYEKGMVLEHFVLFRRVAEETVTGDGSRTRQASQFALQVMKEMGYDEESRSWEKIAQILH